MQIRGLVLQTLGDGYWSLAKRNVTGTKVALTNLSTYNGHEFGELRVYFRKNSWNVESDGLIYTDSGFLNDLKAFFKEKGFSTNSVECDLGYSEMGMQGVDYVSFDVGSEFIRDFRRWTKE